MRLNRDLRHGAFPAVPEGGRPIPEDDPQAPLVRVPNIAWKADDWHHVVLTWSNAGHPPPVVVPAHIKDRVHAAIGVLGAVSVATACHFEASPAGQSASLKAGSNVVRIEHPTGTFDATVLEKDSSGGLTVLSFGGDRAGDAAHEEADRSDQQSGRGKFFGLVPREVYLAKTVAVAGEGSGGGDAGWDNIFAVGGAAGRGGALWLSGNATITSSQLVKLQVILDALQSTKSPPVSVSSA